jgi:hypothetical protein
MKRVFVILSILLMGMVIVLTKGCGGSLYVQPGPLPLLITTTQCPPAVQGVPYNCQLKATGGRPPYLWEIK